MVAEPALRAEANDEYPPLVIKTVPVAIGIPLPPLTATVTVIPWVVFRLVEDGVAVTVGVTFATVTLDEVPIEPLYVGELAASGV